MGSHSFTIIASGLDLSNADELADRLYEAGCDDATLSIQKGVMVLDFDREARTFAGALVSAIDDVRKAGAVVERVEPDHLVSQSEIAKRSGLGRAAISLYAAGARGKGFPRPIARVTTESPLWDWVEVASWMHRHKQLGLRPVVLARLVRDANLMLALESGRSRLGRRLSARAARPTHREVA